MSDIPVLAEPHPAWCHAEYEGDLPHPWIALRREHGPVRAEQGHEGGANGRIALALTRGVGTMWCAYAFTILALLVLPQAIAGGMLTLVQWVSQTFIQLVMLSVIMVGQDILGKAGDRRAERTYRDVEAILHELTRLHERGA